MRRRSLQDVLPPPEFTESTAQPTTDGGLSFVATNETGTEQRRISLERLPGAVQLRADFIAGMQVLNGPRGPWRSVNSVQSGFNSSSAFLRWLDKQGLTPQSVAHLTPAIWKKWLLYKGSSVGAHGVISHIKAIVSVAPGPTSDLLDAMNRRRGNPSRPIQESYTHEEFMRIRRQARKVVHTASCRISANYRLLLERQSGVTLNSHLEERADALFDLFTTGGKSPTWAHFKALDARSGRQKSIARLRQALFLTPDEAWATMLLLAAEAGWNLSVIDRLRVPDTSAGAGDDEVLYTVELHKPRRGPKHQYSTTTELGTSDVGRALGWIIGATDPARAALAAVGFPTDRLVVYRKQITRFAEGPLNLQPGVPTRLERSPFGCVPLPVELASASPQRLRRTRQVLFDRKPTQNTRQTHEDVYVRNDKATHDQARGVIEAGLNNALSHADAIVKLRLMADEAVSENIRSGRADTAFAACCDYDHHPVTGDLCRESFLSCLACTNAVATPRHLPKIVLLYEALEELSSAIGSEEWQERWEIHFVRLDTLLRRHTTDAERSAARNSASAEDRAVIARLLRGGYSAA